MTQSEDLLRKAEKYLSYGVPPITIKDDKKPTLDTWTDIRDSHKLPTKESLTQWLTNPLATHLAIVSGGRFLIVDYDGLGEQRLRTRILPRCSATIQEKVERTTRTRTPRGGHTLIARDSKTCDTKVEEIEAWKLTGNKLEHNEVLLLSSEKYVIERGPGYEPVRDIEVLEQFTNEEKIEFCGKLREVKTETKAIRIIIKRLAPYYEKSNRDKLVFSFSGYVHKYGIPETLIHDTIEDLMDSVSGDEERESRFKVIKETCQKSKEEVSGREELLDAVDGNDSIVLVIQQQYKKLGYFKFADENGEQSTKSEGETAEVQDSSETGEKTGQVTQVLTAVNERIKKLFTDKHGTPYVTILQGDHLENLLINGGRFKKWISKISYEELGKTIKSEYIKEITDLLQAKAIFEGEMIDLKLRAATVTDPKTGKKKFYYDLTNKNWQVVEITEDGWQVKESVDAPTLFHRYSNQLSQITPLHNYRPDIFDRYIELFNVKDEGHKLLLKCYIIAMLLSDIPKAVLILFGTKGAAKTTGHELIRMVIDPSSIESLTFPRDIAQLVQQLSHNYIAYYDNVSVIRDWISDELCRAVTGSGFSKRELYTDDEDIIYQFKRCLGINGINLAATKPDLLDRCIIILLEKINDNQRRKVEDIKQDVENMKSELLSYIFDILVKVLKVKNAGGINIENRTRMADFEEYAEIISKCMGNPDGAFIKAYEENRQLQTDAVIEGSAVATAFVKYMEGRKTDFEGSMTELLSELDSTAQSLKMNIRAKGWPKSANALSRKLNEIRSNLEEVGIEISYDKDPKTRIKRIRVRLCNTSLISSDRSQGQNHAQNQDERSNYISNDISEQESNIVRHHHDSTLKNDAPNDSNDSNDIFHILDPSTPCKRKVKPDLILPQDRAESSESMESESSEKDIESSNDSHDSGLTSREMKFYGGYWHCEKCKEKGDTFYMGNHRCKW